MSIYNFIPFNFITHIYSTRALILISAVHIYSDDDLKISLVLTFIQGGITNLRTVRVHQHHLGLLYGDASMDEGTERDYVPSNTIFSNKWRTDCQLSCISRS